MVTTKVYFTSCGTGLMATDGYVTHIFRFMPGVETVGTPEAADIIIVTWTLRPQFEADLGLIQKIVDSRKPIVVLDYLECRDDDKMFMTRPDNWHATMQAYKPLEALESAIKVYFKRELIRAHVPPLPYPVYVTDFITEAEDAPAETAEAFNARPVDFFMVWGYSSADRPILHAELMRRRFSNLATALEDIDWYIKDGRKGICALLFTPHYRRVPLRELLQHQKLAKLSISMRGASQKCFRHAEAALNSVMAMQECSTEFAFPWTKANCVVLPNLPKPTINPEYWIDVPAAMTALSVALQGDLYSVYLAGLENAAHYKAKNYANEHWLPILRKHGAWI